MTSFIDRYGITSDDDLHNLAKQMGFNIDYIGFAENLNISNLNMLNERKLIVINLGNNEISGTHWCGIVLFNNGNSFYFDSYAAPPEDILIKKLTSKARQSKIAKSFGIKNIIYNDYFQLQGLTEQLCGIWVLSFLKEYTKESFHSARPTPKKIIDQFQKFTKNYTDLNGSYKSFDLIGKSIQL